MKNIKELRDSLLDNYSKMKSKKMNLSLGKELANSAGKVITSVKIELEYNQIMKNNKKIYFLE